MASRRGLRGQQKPSPRPGKTMRSFHPTVRNPSQVDRPKWTTLRVRVSDLVTFFWARAFGFRGWGIGRRIEVRGVQVGFEE